MKRESYGSNESYFISGGDSLTVLGSAQSISSESKDLKLVASSKPGPETRAVEFLLSG